MAGQAEAAGVGEAVAVADDEARLARAARRGRPGRPGSRGRRAARGRRGRAPARRPWPRRRRRDSPRPARRPRPRRRRARRRRPRRRPSPGRSRAAAPARRGRRARATRPARRGLALRWRASPRGCVRSSHGAVRAVRPAADARRGLAGVVRAEGPTLLLVVERPSMFGSSRLLVVAGRPVRTLTAALPADMSWATYGWWSWTRRRARSLLRFGGDLLGRARSRRSARSPDVLVLAFPLGSIAP